MNESIKNNLRIIITFVISSLIITIIHNFNINTYLKDFIIPTTILLISYTYNIKKLNLIINKKTYYLLIPIILILISNLILIIDKSNVYLNIIIIPIQGIGIYGATISSQICHFISFILGFIKLKKMTKVKFAFKKFLLKPVLASVIMSIVSYATYYLLGMIISPKIATLIGLAVAVITYFISIIVLRIFSAEEIKDMPRGEKIYNTLVKFKMYR